MFDADSLDKDLNSQQARLSRSRRGNMKNDDFQMLFTNQLREGTYRFRMLPEHPSRCPEGYHRYTIHKIDLNEDGTNSQKVLCTESYDPDTKCYICELVDVIEAEARSDIESKYPGYWRSIEKLYPNRMIMVPAVFYNLGYTSKRTSYNGKERDSIDFAFPSKDAEPRGIILTISSNPILKRLVDITRKFPGLNSRKNGMTLELVKKSNNHHELDVESDARTVLENADFWLDEKRYPNFQSFGKNNRYDRWNLSATIQTAYYAKALSQYVDLDEEDDREPPMEVPF